MAKKIKLFLAPHVEIRIHVSDQMEADLKECKMLAESTGDGKDCDTCSWRYVGINGEGMCELPAVTDQVLEG